MVDFAKVGQGAGFKVLVILGLVGLLSLVLEMQTGLVSERQSARNEAVDRTVSEWGGEQRFAGPFLKVPYHETVTTGAGANRETQDRESFVFLLPEEFSARAALEGQSRTRGIYEVPLYRAGLRVTGTFDLSSVRDWFPAGARVDYQKAEVWYFLGGARGLDQRPKVLWDGVPRESLRAGLDGKPELDAFWFPVGAPGAVVEFSMDLALKGGASWGVFPAGRDSLVRAQVDRGLPRFGGSFLPSSWKAAGPGFESEWRIPSLARSLPAAGTAQTWTSVLEALPFASFDLAVAFDGYRLINRALKYGLLFIIVPFVGLFLYEVFVRRRLHPVQYLLVGLAVLMFYLLVLSLSERMVFDLAFLAGALAVSCLLGVYCGAILQGGLAGLWCFLGMAGLYGLLYLIIGSEDNALLVGTLFLFALLTVVMGTTRRVDWYRLGRTPGPGDQ